MLRNLVEETANNPGTSTDVNLGGAPAGRRSFAQEFTNGQTPFYFITDGAAAESGLGTFVAGAPNVLQRMTVLWNSAGTTARLNFTGAIRVYNEVPASNMPFFNAAGDLILPGDAVDPLAAVANRQVAWKQLGRVTFSGQASVDVIWDASIRLVRITWGGVSLAAAGTLGLRCLTAGVPDAGASDYFYIYSRSNGSTTADGLQLGGSAIDLSGSLAANDTNKRARGDGLIYPGAAAAAFTCDVGVAATSTTPENIRLMVTGQRLAAGYKNGLRLLGIGGGANIATGEFVVEGCE